MAPAQRRAQPKQNSPECHAPPPIRRKRLLIRQTRCGGVVRVPAPGPPSGSGAPTTPSMARPLPASGSGCVGWCEPGRRVSPEMKRGRANELTLDQTEQASLTNSTRPVFELHKMERTHRRSKTYELQEDRSARPLSTRLRKSPSWRHVSRAAGFDAYPYERLRLGRVNPAPSGGKYLMIRAASPDIFIALHHAEYVCNPPSYPLPILATRMLLRNMRRQRQGFPGDRTGARYATAPTGSGPPR